MANPSCRLPSERLPTSYRPAAFFRNEPASHPGAAPVQPKYQDSTSTRGAWAACTCSRPLTAVALPSASQRGNIISGAGRYTVGNRSIGNLQNGFAKVYRWRLAGEGEGQLRRLLHQAGRGVFVPTRGRGAGRLAGDGKDARGRQEHARRHGPCQLFARAGWPGSAGLLSRRPPPITQPLGNPCSARY